MRDESILISEPEQTLSVIHASRAQMWMCTHMRARKCYEDVLRCLASKTCSINVSRIRSADMHDSHLDGSNYSEQYWGIYRARKKITTYLCPLLWSANEPSTHEIPKLKHTKSPSCHNGLSGRMNIMIMRASPTILTGVRMNSSR